MPKEFDDLLKQYEKEIVKVVSKRFIELLKEAIEEVVYSYNPTWWSPENNNERTGQFKESVDFKYEKGNLIVFINTEKLNYYSWVNYRKTDKNVSEIVPWLIQEGHSDDSGVDNMYHNYNGRDYLGVAYEKIKKEFPELEIKIINNQPNWI